MNRTLGENIKEFRLRMYLTREDLARNLKVSPQLVLDWEENLLCPDMFHIPDLAENLGTTMEELFDVQIPSDVYLSKKAQPKDIYIKIKSSLEDQISINLPLEVIRNFLASGDLCASASLNNSEALKYIPWDQVLELADSRLLGIYMNGTSSLHKAIFIEASAQETFDDI